MDVKRRRPDGVDPAARSRARKRALQAIYAWQLGGRAMRDVIEEFAHEQEREFADLDYFHDLLLGIERNVKELDAALLPFLDRAVDQVDPIERGVLRLAAYELLHRIDVPYRVVINEAIETTKKFGADHGHTYVNGVLDHACAEWRRAEFNAARQRR